MREFAAAGLATAALSCAACAPYTRAEPLVPGARAESSLGQRCLDVVFYPYVADASTGAIELTYVLGDPCDEVAQLTPEVRARYGPRWIHLVPAQVQDVRIDVDAFERKTVTIEYVPDLAEAPEAWHGPAVAREVCVAASPGSEPACRSVMPPESTRPTPSEPELVRTWPFDVFSSLGSSLHVVPMGGTTIDNKGFRFAGDPLGRVTAWSIDFPFPPAGVAFGRFYAYLSIELGAHDSSPTALPPAALGTVVSGEGLFGALGPVLGARVVRVGRWGLRSEALVGGRLVLFDNNLDGMAPSTAPAQCVNKARTNNRCNDLVLTQGVVEPRLAIDGWITPWVAASVWSGVDVVPFPYGGWSLGASLSVHLRSFGEPR